MGIMCCVKEKYRCPRGVRNSYGFHCGTCIWIYIHSCNTQGHGVLPVVRQMGTKIV